MKNLFYLPVMMFLVSGCMQSVNITPANKGGERVVFKGPDTLCFERYSGGKRQDTSSVRLIVEGEQVSGQFSNFPYEKDARIGTIRGRKSGNLISGTWQYMQEGLADSINFQFMLKGDKLLQRETIVDRTTGREKLSDTGEFTDEFNRISCRDVNSRMQMR